MKLDVAITDQDDWFVPGGSFEVEPGRMIRLRPPELWRRFVLVVPRMPPSMNRNEIRSHWRGFHGHKKQWQEELATLMMVEKVPRGFQRAVAGGFLRAPTAHRRDSGNFSGVVEKALGDALTSREVIADDDATQFFFGGVEFEEVTGAPRTTVVIYLQPKED